MIYLDSRYADGTIFKANHSYKGTYELTVFRNFPSAVSTFYYYEVIKTDRIDSIATEVFGDATYWHQIMDFNPEILNPMFLTPGTLLRIPYVS